MTRPLIMHPEKILSSFFSKVKVLLNRQKAQKDGQISKAHQEDGLQPPASPSEATSALGESPQETPSTPPQLNEQLNSILKVPGSSSKKRKFSLHFNTDPTIFEFDMFSPTKRRMEQRFLKDPAELDTDELLMEVEAHERKKEARRKAKYLAADLRRLDRSMHEDSASLPMFSKRRRLSTPKVGGVLAAPHKGDSIPQEPEDLSKEELIRLVNDIWTEELKEEILSYGVTPKGERQELADRLNLLQIINRRAHLRTAGVLEPLHTLDEDSLDEDLRARRIEPNGRSRYDKLILLEAALLKEQDALLVDGYTFGKRFISVDEYLRPLTDNEMRQILQKKKMQCPRRKAEKRTVLKKTLKAELTDQKRAAFVEALKMELELKDLPSSPTSDINELFDCLFLCVREKKDEEQRTAPNSDGSVSIDGALKEPPLAPEEASPESAVGVSKKEENENNIVL